ncbi:CapA family protein [Pseudobutyrivibrio ruminis]|uniref:CapA family protein n=1 Tax=Pseudobutyrivibrio ruminis TaxID=46206 RepID=UPI0004118155|nr:CapA family protein [Pseudobutyrivibrio ruminis]
MKKCNYLCLVILYVSVFLLNGCGKKITEVDTVHLEENQPQKIEIVDLSDAWDTILNNSTNEFIGGHPVDESFLGMVTADYGEEVIEEIASYANFDTPDIWYQLTGKSIHVLWYEYCDLTGLQQYNFDKTYVLDKQIDGDIVLDFTGDVSFANGIATTNYMDHQMNGIYDCFSQDLLDEMQSADILMINNEFCYSDRGTALAGKAYTFRANPNRVSLLSDLGADIVSVANNHVYDYDEIGFLDTLDTLAKANMPYVGAGVNLEEARKPVYFIIGGRKIAIVAATQIERTLNYTKEATGVSPGVMKCLHPEAFCETIKEAKANADYVIVFPHWGTEGNAYHGGDQVALARVFVEAGADAIIGGHTHCLQSVEYIDNVPVFYSLGNYWFATTGNMPSTYDTGLAQIRITPEGNIESKFIPCQFNAGVTSMLNSEDIAYSNIIDSLNKMSISAVIDGAGNINKK